MQVMFVATWLERLEGDEEFFLLILLLFFLRDLYVCLTWRVHAMQCAIWASH